MAEDESRTDDTAEMDPVPPEPKVPRVYYPTRKVIRDCGC